MEALIKANDTDSSSGTDIPISVVPVAIKPPSIVNWKISKLGRKGVYQIIIEDGTYITYINFGAMLKSISNDDLTELYRLVMQSTDPVWNLPYQQKMLSWRYYDTCIVHCLNLESTDIYMLTERRYPLPADVCQAILSKKLQGDKKDEACYQLLKLHHCCTRALATPDQTATGKEILNPFIADSLLKTIKLSMHLVTAMKHLLGHSKRLMLWCRSNEMLLKIKSQSMICFQMNSKQIIIKEKLIIKEKRLDTILKSSN
ncbi:hypothetical protein Tco_1332475 [Tanacetum coccineum]